MPQSRYQGQADIPMNETGRAQARRNGEALRSLLPGIAHCSYVASPLLRARETMEIVRSAMGLEPRAYALDPRLKEIHYGDWQGIFAKDLPGIDAAGMRRARAIRSAGARKGGESYEDLMVRSVDWLGDVTRDTVVSAHGGVSRVLRGHLYGLDAATACRSCPCRRTACSSCAATACIGCRERAKERAGAAAAPALPSDVRCPLGDGCSSRQGAAQMSGTTKGRPVTHTLLATRDRRI